MHVAVCSIELFLPQAESLKEKRRSIKSIMQKIRDRVNASVAETDFQDMWQRSEIGVAMVSRDKMLLEKEIGLIRRIIDDYDEVELITFGVDYR